MVTSATPASTMLKMFSGALRGLSEGAAVRSSLAFMRHSCSWSERAWRERCSRRCVAARSAGCLLREEVYELEVLELGGQGRGELGLVRSLAYLAGHLKEGLHGSRERHVSPAEGHYRALYLRAVLDLYQAKMPRCHRGYDRRPGQERHAQAVFDHPLGSLDAVELYRLKLPDARVPEKRTRQLVVARGVVEEYELLAPDLRQLRRSLLCKAMLRVHHQHELVLVKRHALHLRVAHRPRQPELYLLLQNHLQNVLRVPGPHRDRHPGVRCREALQDRRQSVRAYPRRSSQGQPPARSASE